MMDFYRYFLVSNLEDHVRIRSAGNVCLNADLCFDHVHYDLDLALVDDVGVHDVVLPLVRRARQLQFLEL